MDRVAEAGFKNNKTFNVENIRWRFQKFKWTKERKVRSVSRKGLGANGLKVTGKATVRQLLSDWPKKWDIPGVGQEVIAKSMKINKGTLGYKKALESGNKLFKTIGVKDAVDLSDLKSMISDQVKDRLFGDFSAALIDNLLKDESIF